jgi:large subunit ribosomal protein L15
MLTLNNLAPIEGARTAKQRVGRGPGSGSGKTAARGHKGARARAGYSAKSGFEGGQMPLHRRLPKRGFNNIFKTEYTIVSLEQLNTFNPGDIVDINMLITAGFIQTKGPVKILANGEITKSLIMKIDKISRRAQEKIIAAGGVIEE